MEATEMTLEGHNEMVRAVLRNYKTPWISSKKSPDQSKEKPSAPETKESASKAKIKKTGE